MNPEDKSFNHLRLDAARKLRGLTVSELAERLPVSRRSLTDYLAGKITPNSETVSTLAQTLEMPEEFFFRADLEIPSADAVSFRSLARMKASNRDKALTFGGLAAELSEWIAREFNTPSVTVPDLGFEDDPEIAANILRSEWGWGEAAIPNMVHLLEHKGVRVFSVAVESHEVDAFSLWLDEKPYVFLNTMKSAERSRFDAAHELGHLLMHRHSLRGFRDAEREAHAFASFFLMPRRSLLASLKPNPSVRSLLQRKAEWGVSVAALATACQRVGLYTDWQYRSVFKEITRKGYRRHEPESIMRESSKVFPQILNALRADGLGRAHIADKLGVSIRDLDSLMFGLGFTSITGGIDRKSNISGDRPKLRVVTNECRSSTNML